MTCVGSSDGAVVRAPMWPRFYSGPVPYVVRVFCWFWSCSEGFSPCSLVFHAPQKSTFPNSNSTRIDDRIKKKTNKTKKQQQQQQQQKKTAKTDVMYATPRFVLLFLCVISFCIYIVFCSWNVTNTGQMRRRTMETFQWCLLRRNTIRTT